MSLEKLPLFTTDRSRKQLFVLALCAVLSYFLTLSITGARTGDEVVNYAQSLHFLRGDFYAIPQLTLIPGYHALVAALMWVSGVNYYMVGRVATTAFAILAVFGFFKIRRQLFPAQAQYLPVLQFAFLPLFFPYAWLYYTDVPALALTLWAFSFSLSRRHVISAAIGINAILFRQVSVLWIVLFAAIELLRQWQEGGDFRQRVSAAIRLWPYAVVIVAFLAYWRLNGTVAFSSLESQAHPDFDFGLGNSALLLALVTALFSPLLIAWLARFVNRAINARFLWLVPLLVFLAVWKFFRVEHPYNHLDPVFWVRNRLLLYIESNDIALVTFSLFAGIGVAALLGMKVPARRYSIILPFSLFAVSALTLIEQRYSMVPLALILAVKCPESAVAETWLTVFWLVASCVVSYAVLSRWFMI